MKRNLFFALWAVMAALVSCSGPERAIGGGPGVKEAAVEVSGPASSVTAGLADPAQGSAGTADPARGSAGTTDPAAEDAVEAALWTKALALARSLDDRQLAAQVLMAGTDGTEQVPPWMKDIFAEAPPGAVMLFSYNVAGNTDRIAFFLAELKETVAEKSLVPFIAVDHEGGSVNRFARLTGSFPPPLFYGEEAEKTGGEAALGKVYGDARRAAGELKALGITMNLAPVAEILTGDNRAFLGDRSYGGDSAFSGEAASLFVLAMREEGIASAAKHFPGHGGSDPHEGQSVLPYSAGELYGLASSFKTVIEKAAPAALMVSHVMVPALDSENSASLSPRVMRSWIREELGFEGIILADDFSMKAARPVFSSSGEAAAVAIKAGADMVMVWPPDIRNTHRALLLALQNGTISRERLEEASARIIREKFRYGLLE